MVRYLRLYRRYFTTSLISEIEFRSGFIVLSVAILMQSFITVAFFGVLYGSITSINGWTYHEVLFLLSTYMIIMNITHALFNRNFSRTSEYVREGKLDLLLTKPVDAQFSMTTRYIGIADLFNMIPSCILLGYALGHLDVAISPFTILVYLAGLLIGCTIVYGIWFAISILSFWLTQVDEIQELWEGISFFMQYPRSIFTGIVRLLLTFVIPILTIAAFPSEWFLGRLSGWWIVLMAMIALTLVVGTRKLWMLGLRRYSSASS